MMFIQECSTTDHYTTVAGVTTVKHALHDNGEEDEKLI